MVRGWLLWKTVPRAEHTMYTACGNKDGVAAWQFLKRQAWGYLRTQQDRVSEPRQVWNSIWSLGRHWCQNPPASTSRVLELWMCLTLSCSWPGDWEYKQEKQNPCPHTNLYSTVHSTTVCNSPREEIAQILANWWVKKPKRWHFYLLRHLWALQRNGSLARATT